MTPEELMKAIDTDLPRLLDGILSGPFKHDAINHGTHHVKCKRCDEIIPLMDRWDVRERYPCWVSPFDDSIPITPEEAFKWRDWAVAEYGGHEYLVQLISIYQLSGTKRDFEYWLIVEAKPKHYEIAAALCKLNAEGSRNAR